VWLPRQNAANVPSLYIYIFRGFRFKIQRKRVAIYIVYIFIYIYKLCNFLLWILWPAGREKKAQATLKSMLPFSLNHLNGVAEKEKSRENKVGKREVE